MQPTEEVILNVIDQLKNPDLVDQTSDKFKAFVLDLLKTANPEVVEKIMLKDEKFDPALFTKDKASFETAANMFKAIRDKELRGERLSDTEHALKDTFQESQYEDGFHIEADPEKGVVEKYMRFDENGNVYYSSGDIITDSPELMDEFATKFNAADTADKKSALFKEYTNTRDSKLQRTLARKTESFNASMEDIESLITNLNLQALRNLNVKSEYKAELYKKAAEKAKELFLADKGNLDNARYLIEIFYRINVSGLSKAEKTAIKTEILDSFFTVTTAEDGTKTYKFEPSRRPTYEEMDELAGYATEEMREALVKSIKLEDMGKNEYSDAIERWAACATLVPHFAQFIDGMTEEEVVDFIKNKVAYTSDIPNDKILEKFPENYEIRELLVRKFNDDSIISDENGLSLIKDYIKVNDDTWELKDNLPDGITTQKLISLLPEKCDEGEARKVFDTILKSLGAADFDELDKIAKHIEDKSVVRAKLDELVKENAGDTEFIEEILTEMSDSGTIPFEALLEIDASGISQGARNRMFEDFFKYQERGIDIISKACEHGWMKHLGNNIVEIEPESETLYRVDTKDDNRRFYPISREGYEKGLDMYDDVKGLGSGEIRDKLKQEGYFTKENIISIITTFNNRTEHENIIGYIDNEWGPSQSEMNVIPNTLLALAADKGLEEDETYKELSSLIKSKTNTYSDYGDVTAKRIDDLMNELIRKIEGR